MQAHQDVLNRGPLQDGLDWAKDLVLGNGHAVGHVAEDSWGNVVPLVTCSLAFSSALTIQGRQGAKLHSSASYAQGGHLCVCVLSTHGSR